MTVPRRERATRRAARGEAGLALVTVILVLVALALIATPFALSMRNLESSALLGLRIERARAGAGLALAAARRHLEDTHPFYDLETPHADDADEIAPADLAERFPDLLPRDPRGAIRSVAIEDEQGKVHLGTAPPALLGNLLGGRTFLTAAVDEDADVLAVASTEGMAPAGLALVGAEQVEYSLLGLREMREVRRGYASANVLRSVPAAHPLGTEVLDARLVLLVQRGWHLRPGVFEPFTRVGALKDLAFFAEMTYTAEDLERVADLVTVHGGPARWREARRVLDLSTLREGGSEIVVADGSRYGQGTVVRLENEEGEVAHDLVLECVDWGDGYRLRLLEDLPPRTFGPKTTTVSALVRVPVNVATADPRVIAALLEGLGWQPVVDVVAAEEAAHIAVLVHELGTLPGELTFRRAAATELEEGRFSTRDLTTAGAAMEAAGIGPRDRTEAELAAWLTGRRALRPSERIGRQTARRLAARVAAARPGSHEELRGLLAGAVDDGICTEDERRLVLLAAVDPGDARLVGGTAPFTYRSDGVFTLRAACIDNAANGRERGRAFVQEVVSVAPPGETGHVLDSQADLEAAARPAGGLSGWASWPRRLAAGPAEAAPPRAHPDAELFDWPRRDPGPTLAAGADRPDRGGAVLAGDPGPSHDPDVSFLAPAPVRSSLPHTLHFDEGQPGLSGDGPDGLDLSREPLALAAEAVVPSPRGPTSEHLHPFAVEMWFQLVDVMDEVVLFDGGTSDLEDRVLLMMSDGELVLRVSDTSIADFEADMPEGRPPPAGEIRYAFDDGLELLPDVPYHVLAWIGGARDSSLALFVDGVPRGQRTFTTALAADVPAAGSTLPGSPSPGSLRMAVESTAGFPARGAIRVGEEIMEYVDKDDDSFLVRSEGTTDPFGGRARRGTLAREHETSEMVELVGYSRPLASDLANQGVGALDGELSAFTIAEIDVTRTDLLSYEHIVDLDPSQTSGDATNSAFPLGTGLEPTGNAVPVRGLGGGGLPNGAFQSGGGHAILFCDYGYSDLVGLRLTLLGGGITTTLEIPDTTEDGALIGGAEVVRYQSFDGTTLQGVQRASSGLPQSVGPNPSPLASASQDWVLGTGGTYSDSRAFITTFSQDLLDLFDQANLPAEARVLVMPLSVAVSSADPWSDFHPGLRFAGRSVLTQIGLDFPEGGGGTEWVRWNTAAQGGYLVRDDLEAVENALGIVDRTDVWRLDSAVQSDDLSEAMGVELDLRGQAATPDTDHPGGEQVLPAIVFGEWGTDVWDPTLGIPGRHDSVTLAGDDGEREFHIVNFATTRAEEWLGYCLVGLRDPVTREFRRTDPGLDAHYAVDDLDLDRALRAGQAGVRLMEELELSGRDALVEALQPVNVDSRRLTRLIKSPSGELPSLPVATLHLGSDGPRRGAGAPLRVDELRLHVADAPGPLLPPTSRYVLDDELPFDEDRAMVLSVGEVFATHARQRRRILGADRLEVLSELPPGGGLLLVGEEIVGYAGLDPVDTGSVFLAGRGLYGTRRARHEQGEAVVPLLFWPASPLTEPIAEDAARLPVADPEAFPEGGGLLWIGEELVGYTARGPDGLVMPSRPGRAAGGLLRGRFGTTPSRHGAGTMVRWMPARVTDRGLLGEDVAESEAAILAVRAPGAFVTDVVVRGGLPDRTNALSARVVLDGHGSRHDDPTGTPTVVELAPGDAGYWQGSVGRHADVIELALTAVWLPGAFDAFGFASNGWKTGPEVDAVVVGHLQPSLVLEHEEWR